MAGCVFPPLARKKETKANTLGELHNITIHLITIHLVFNCLSVIYVTYLSYLLAPVPRFILFFVTMKRQIAHMIKYKYLPFTLGKKVGME